MKLTCKKSLIEYVWTSAVHGIYPSNVAVKLQRERERRREEREGGREGGREEREGREGGREGGRESLICIHLMISMYGIPLSLSACFEVLLHSYKLRSQVLQNRSIKQYRVIRRFCPGEIPLVFPWYTYST